VDAAAILRRARTAHALSLRGLAAHAGTSHATLAAYESGSKVPSVVTFTRVLRAAGVDLVPVLTWRVPPDAGRGDELEAVLRLAAQFPAEHTARWRAPVFGSRPG
jgi:transcriptional regulator with XRE-family HTH domain